MKDSIFHVPIAENFIDLEHLLHISHIQFSDFGETVGLELTYMFRKEKESIFVRARELFGAEEMKNYEGYKLDSVMNHSAGNEQGRRFREDSIKSFEEQVRLPTYNAWKAYRESKNK